MDARFSVRRFAIGIAALAFALGAFAQTPTQTPAAADFTPTVGQPGKDVVWVPSPQALVDKMLDMAKVTPKDFVMDLGSGDGRTVITAAKRGARAVGIEYNADMVALSRRNAAKEGVSGKATFVEGDIFLTDLSQATVITLFLLTDLNLKLRPTLLSLKPGTRIVSNTFHMAEWEPDESFELNCETYCTAYLWIVPAKVEGRWQTAQGELTLKQEFQKVTGTLHADGRMSTISRARLRGDQISFTAGNGQYRGKVRGAAIEGSMTSGERTVAWEARLIP